MRYNLLGSSKEDTKREYQEGEKFAAYRVGTRWGNGRLFSFLRYYYTVLQPNTQQEIFSRFYHIFAMAKNCKKSKGKNIARTLVLWYNDCWCRNPLPHHSAPGSCARSWGIFVAIRPKVNAIQTESANVQKGIAPAPWLPKIRQLFAKPLFHE